MSLVDIKNSPFELAHGEGEIGVGEGFVAEGEVPPLAVEGFEAVTEHSLTENHAVAKLGFGDAPAGRTLVVVAGVLTCLGVAAEVGMALWSEPVEGAAHVEFFLGGHVEEGEVNGGTARVTALLVDIFLFEEYALVEVGIEIGLHEGVGNVGSPAHEMVNTFLRTVGVVDFQSVALPDDVVADGTEAIGGSFGEQRGGLLIAVDAGANEVVGAVVADFEYGVGYGIGKGYKLAGIIGRTDLLRIVGSCQRVAGDAEDGREHPQSCALSFHVVTMFVMMSKGTGKQTKYKINFGFFCGCCIFACLNN